MEYHEAARTLFGLRRYPPRPGVEATRDLLDRLGNPKVPAVQVAGSNGKGTTARMTERVLREAGLSVGLYTSPHLDDVRERIRVDGRPVRKAAVADYVDAVAEYLVDRGADGDSPTFFEALTGLALWEFDRQDVDVAVLEVGIGGRYDATSAVDPVASAVTSVSVEHADFLGDDRATIAEDQAQVAPAGGPLVTAATGPALSAVRSVADRVVTVGSAVGGAGPSYSDGSEGADGSGGSAGDGSGDRPDRSDPDVAVDYGGRRNRCEADVSLSGRDWRVDAAVPTPGAHQARNAGVAAALARAVGEHLDRAVGEAAIERGLRNAHWPGRFEVLAADPLTVLDGAHNPGACDALAATLAEFDHDDLYLIAGALVDKDLAGMVEALPAADRVYACRPAVDRAEHHDVVARAFEEGGAPDVRAVPDPARALDRALAAADPGDCVLATGSLHVVARTRRRWTATGVARSVEDPDDARAVLSGADVPVGSSTADGDRGTVDGDTAGADADDGRRSDPGGRSAGGDPRAEELVHRTVELRLRSDEARRLRERLRSVGGDCAVSAAGDREELRTVVASATLDQFRRAIAGLDAPAADHLRSALGLDAGPAPGPGDSGDGRHGDASKESAGRSARRGSVGDPVDSSIDWIGDRTAVMGIVNVTPDSFYDGGEYDAVDEATERARRLVEAGVDVIDVGGESTRPGADPVPVPEERDRVVPVVESIRDAVDAPISVDTRKAPVARAALAAGADVVNDVSGLADPEMRFVVAEYDADLVVMHSIEAPVDPDRTVEYDDVVTDTRRALRERVLLAERAGVPRDRIVVDPGLGFGKSPRECFELLDRIEEFRALGCPVLAGHSHKSMFGPLGYGGDERLSATVATTALAADRGADVVRVHDGPENVAAVRAALAVEDPDVVED